MTVAIIDNRGTRPVIIGAGAQVAGALVAEARSLRNESLAAQSAAEAARDDAQNAKDLAGAAALSLGNVYANTAAGLAATTDGDYFWTVDPANLYLNDSGSAVLQDELATTGRSLGAFTSPLIPDNATTKEVIEGFATNLKAASGSEEVGFSRGETGAQSNSVSGKLKQTLNFLDFVPSAQRAAMLDRTTTYDASGAFQAAVDALGAEGGCIDISNMKIRVSGTVTLSCGVWKPVLIRGAAGSEIVSTHDGLVFDDETGAIRLENVKMTGPGLSNINAIAVKSILSRGHVRDCEISGYRVGIDIGLSTNPVIERNRFSLCQEGIRSVQTSPDFSNIISIRDNYFDFNTFGIYMDNVFGVLLENNAFEYNSVGAYFDDARLVEFAGNNWFELDTTPYQFAGSSTARIGPGTRLVSPTNPPAIAWGTCKVEDASVPATCLLEKGSAQAIPHNANTNLTWNVEVQDPSGMHNNSSYTDQVFITRPGVYHITLNVPLASYTSGAGEFLRIGITNGGTVIRRAQVPVISGQPTYATVSFYAYLATGDIIRGQAYQNSGSDKDVLGGSGASLAVVFVDIAA